MALEVRTLETGSAHGRAVQELHRQDTGSGRRLAVLLPGQAYSCQRPLLHYARLSALAAGCDVLCIAYGFEAARRPGPGGEFQMLAEEVRAAIAWAGSQGGDPPEVLLIAKSIGTAVAREILREAGRTPWRAFLLTPVERAAALVEEAGATAVIGTADPFFERPGIQASIAAHPASWHIFRGLDHSLERPGDVPASLAALGSAMELLQAFLVPA